MGDKKQPPLRHRPLLELATAQHGVVSTRQLARIGYTRSSASKAHGVGRMRRVHRGVYAVGHERLTWEGRCLAAVLASSPSVASHVTAAWLWGILRTRPGTIHLTAPTKRRSKAGAVVHSADLAEIDITELDGIPATALPRTLLDLASTSPIERLAKALRRAEELRALDLGPIDALLSRSVGHRGTSRLRAALDIYREEPAFTRSGLEDRFFELVKAAKLPLPSMNFVVGGFELDAYWEREQFVVELDIYETHGTHDAFERDRLRQDDLLLIGVEMIRVTGPRLRREPVATIDRVAAHLERRRRELSAS
jgi:Transcriptional regulator, AbiEi antitoxin